MDYVRQGAHLDSRPFGVFPVDGRTTHTTVDGKSRVTVYGAWSKHMGQYGYRQFSRFSWK